MSCCKNCENILKLGCIDPCEKLRLGYVVPVAGTYILEVDFNGSMQTISANFEAGNFLEFDMNGLNEHYCFKGQIRNSEGEILHFIDEQENVYDCIRFCTRQGHAQNYITPLNTTICSQDSIIITSL